MWDLNWTETYDSRLKRLKKDHTQEVEQVLKNLDTYLTALKNGVKPMQVVKLPCVRNEQLGIHAIDQTPLRKRKKILRLYVYASEAEKILYLITFGDKDQQSDDVRECCKFVRNVQKKIESKTGPSEQ